MGKVQITLSDELHRKLKVKAALEGKTLQAVILEALAKSVK